MTSDPNGDTAPFPSPANAVSPTLVPADPPAPDEATVLKALQATLAKLEKAAGLQDPVEMVHDARKAMKEYRGLLRLVPTKTAKAARQKTAAAARALSAARDRAAAVEALDELAKLGFIGATDRAAAEAAIGTDPDEGREAESHRAEIATFLRAARERLDGALGTEAASADLVEGLAKAYGKARRAPLGSPREMHEARKRVIAHRYQMSFFATFFSGRGGKRAGRAQELRDLLGAYQDIETLRPMLEAKAEALGDEALARLSKAMARRQKRLKHAALALHRKLFHRKPKTFARKFHLAG